VLGSTDAAVVVQADKYEEDDTGRPAELYGIARDLLPAAMIEAVVREPHLTRLAMVDLLRELFATLFDEIKRGWSRPSQWTSRELYGGANLCVVLNRVLASFDDPLALGRIGPHPLECHFGVVREILRGDDQRARWQSAEVRVELAAECTQARDLPEPEENSVAYSLDLERTVELARA
jgi:hypothetical protein